MIISPFDGVGARDGARLGVVELTAQSHHLRLGRIGSRLACMEGMGGDLGGSLGSSEGGCEGRSFPLGSGHMTREAIRCHQRSSEAI